YIQLPLRQPLVEKACPSGIFGFRFFRKPFPKLLGARLLKQQRQYFQVDSFVSQRELKMSGQGIFRKIGWLKDQNILITPALNSAPPDRGIYTCGNAQGPGRQAIVLNQMLIANGKRVHKAPEFSRNLRYLTGLL